MIGPVVKVEARLSATILAILALSLTGCNAADGSPHADANGGVDASAGPGAAASASLDAGPTSCVVGAWRSDGYAVHAAAASAIGGGGFTMTIGSDGRSVVDFAGMRPVTVTVTVGGSSIDSHLVYGGKVAGKLKLPAAGTTTGQWESEPGVDFGTVTITLDVNGTKVMDHVPLSELAAKPTGGGVPGGANTRPVLGAGTYTCSGDKLTIVQRAGTMSATWMLHRDGASARAVVPAVLAFLERTSR
jgi:hypothetical protein